jgi:hypothetical protein
VRWCAVAIFLTGCCRRCPALFPHDVKIQCEKSSSRRTSRIEYQCKESDARSLRGGGGELDNLKTLTYGFTNFTQR